MARRGRSSVPRAARPAAPQAVPAARARTELDGALTATNHFGHRETDGLVVDLFWTRGDLDDDFRVDVEDRLEGTRFALYPATGRDAVQAFHHPFATAGGLDSHRLRPGERRTL